MITRNYSGEVRKLLKEHPQCELCGDKRNLEVHHIVPVCCGGSNDVNNLIVVCGVCHSKLTPKRELTKIGKDYYRRIHAMKLRYYELAEQLSDNGFMCFADAFDVLMKELEDHKFDQRAVE